MAKCLNCGGEGHDWCGKQPKLASFDFEVWIEKLEMYVAERFNGRETGL